MRGLAKSKPSTARVKVNSRYARKHYGQLRRTQFDEEIHDRSRRLVIRVENARKIDY